MATNASGEVDPLIGEVLGSYRVLSQIGQGGMGAVYLAEHPVIGRRAAIKVILPEFSGRGDLIARFHSEARAAAKLRHPAFVDVFDFGTLPTGSSYLVMEFLEGQSLAACIARHGRLSLAAAVGIARQVAVAVGIAHQHGIVHRDLKPDNVYLTPHPYGNGLVLVKVLDFGVAKLTQPNHDGAGLVTRTGAILGTPLYMSPEQCRGAGNVDQRSDVYSLGCLLHSMLVGGPPFPYEGVGEVIGAHIYKEPPRLRAIDPSLPVEIETLVLAMLAKEPGARPQSMKGLVESLDAVPVMDDPASAASLSVSALGLSAGELAAEPGSMLSRATSTAVLPAERNTAILPVPTTRAPNTTLGESAAAVVSPERSSRKRAPRGRFLFLGGAAAAAGLLLVSAFVVVGRPPRSRDPGTQVALPEPELVPAGQSVEKPLVPPPGAADRAAIERPPAEFPQNVRMSVVSDPDGATVREAETGRLLGKTPLELSLPRSAQAMLVSVEMDGYRAKTIRLVGHEDGQASVKLNRKTLAAPRPAENKPKTPAVDPQAIRKL